jgi:hypothetical protein
VVPPQILGKDTVLCRPPALQDLAVTFNRFLKFHFPVQRNLQAIERLLLRQLLQPKLSKRNLDNLPIPLLESMAHQLWEALLPSRHLAENTLLTLLILLEDLRQFKAEAWVYEDTQLLGTRDASPLHSYYFAGQLDRLTLHTILAKHDYTTHYLDALPPEASAEELFLGYLADRCLTRVIPWVELFEALTPEDYQGLPFLSRLHQCHQHLRNTGLYEQTPLRPDSLHEACTALAPLLEATVPQAAPENEAVSADVIRPVQELVIVEGATEEILLPRFAQLLGFDFQALGIQIVPAGGKNQAQQLYQKYADVLNVPIFVILDLDAQDKLPAMQSTLRPGDCLYLLKEGEFEDMYGQELVLRTINEHYHPHPRVTRRTFQEVLGDEAPVPQAQALKQIWRHCNLGDFDKAHFASKLALSAQACKKLPNGLSELINAIVETRPHVVAPAS